MPRRLHAWIRRWLWSWAALLALVVVLGPLLGGRSSGMYADEAVPIMLAATAFASLFLAGLIEYRAGRRDRDG